MQNKTNDINKLILKTAGKTSIILVVLLLLVSTLFILLAPLSAGNFLCVLGWNEFSAVITYNEAKQSDEFDDYYQSFVRASHTKNYSLIYNIAVDVINHKYFESKISDYNLNEDDIDYGNFSFDAKDYVYNNYIKSGVIINKGTSKTLWDKARELDSAKGKRYTPVCAISGYAKAFAIDTKMELGDTLERLKVIYHHDTLFSTEYGDFRLWSMYSRIENDIHNGYQNVILDALSIIEARKITGAEKDYWIELAKIQNLNT